MSPLPRFEPVARLRPVALVQPGTDVGPVPCAAAEADGTGPATLRSGSTSVRAGLDGDGRVVLEVEHRGRTHRAVGRGGVRPDAVAVTLTGPVATAFAREAGAWTGRARAVLPRVAPGTDVHHPDWLAGLTAQGDRTGRFGQLGLRDLRLVAHADGTPYRPSDAPGAPHAVLLLATSAGPGGFRTAHTSVWSLDPVALTLSHRADLFVRRDGRVLGDHAGHLVHGADDGTGGWLLATSTWGDFALPGHPHVGTTLARTVPDVDPTRGCHVLDADSWPLPVTGLRSVGTWDPHLVHTGEEWLVAYVSAERFFRFHPVLAAGPHLTDLRLRAAADRRTACEGPTLHRTETGAGGWRVLASEGPGGRRGQRGTYPVLDLGLRECGRLEARHAGNIPWPTLLPAAAGHPATLIGFDGTVAGGSDLPYGGHGDVLLQHAVEATPTPLPTVPVR